MSVHGELGAVEGAEDDLADLPRHGIKDEEEEDSDQCQQQQQHQDAPVPAPDEEDEGLQRVHKPVEGGFGAAVGEQVVSDEETLACLHHRHPRPLPRIWPRLLCPPLTWASPRAQDPCAPFPTGRFSASSTVSSSNSASTFPWKRRDRSQVLGWPQAEPRPSTPDPPTPPTPIPAHREEVDVAS